MEIQSIRTDDRLVLDYLSGDNGAFDELLARYKSSVFGYLMSRTSDRNVAEDLFQDVFVKVVVSLKEGKYTPNGCFRFWLNTIMRHVLIDRHRRKCILSEDVNEDNDLSVIKDISVMEKSHEEELLHRQTVDSAMKLMEHLPDNQREVVYMKIFENKSFKEIAEQTNVSVNTSLGRMRYAVINMRKTAVKYKCL